MQVDDSIINSPVKCVEVTLISPKRTILTLERTFALSEEIISDTYYQPPQQLNEFEDLIVNPKIQPSKKL